MEVGTAKECVTTHLPNGLALKMEVAKGGRPYSALWCRRAWCQRGSSSVKNYGADISADLGGSSKYSNANLED